MNKVLNYATLTLMITFFGSALFWSLHPKYRDEVRSVKGNELASIFQSSTERAEYKQKAIQQFPPKGMSKLRKFVIISAIVYIAYFIILAVYTFWLK